jgi:hypothetical protein
MSNANWSRITNDDKRNKWNKTYSLKKENEELDLNANLKNFRIKIENTMNFEKKIWNKIRTSQN